MSETTGESPSGPRGFWARIDRLSPALATLLGAGAGAGLTALLLALHHPAATAGAFLLVPLGLGLVLTGRMRWAEGGEEAGDDGAGGEEAVDEEAADERTPGEEREEPEPGQIVHVALEEPAPMRFVHIPAGTFLMGSPKGEEGWDTDEGPQHAVSLGSFAMAATPVTQAQYRAVTGESPSHHGGDGDRPVENVDWYRAAKFCNALSEQEGRTPAYEIEKDRVRWNPHADGYRLPTEAEWEYACRAGSTGRWCFGDDEKRLGEYAWYDKNASNKTHAVAQKASNAWGLFDMHGNVWEWCYDAWDEGAYAHRKGDGAPTHCPIVDVHGDMTVRGDKHVATEREAAASDGALVDTDRCGDKVRVSRDETGKDVDKSVAMPGFVSTRNADSPRSWRVVRGGCYWGWSGFTRSAFRVGVLPEDWDWFLGFRCVLGPPREL